MLYILLYFTYIYRETYRQTDTEDRETEIYYKELIYMVMEADNSQHLRTASWRVDGVVPV